MLEKTGFIGAGKVGTALAVLLSRKGYKIVSVYDQDEAAANTMAKQISGCRIYNSAQQAANAAELVFITTPDSAIPVIAATLKWKPGQAVVHCSGVDSTAILEPAAELGALVAAFHPLQTLPALKKPWKIYPVPRFLLKHLNPCLQSLRKWPRILAVAGLS